MYGLDNYMYSGMMAFDCLSDLLSKMVSLGASPEWEKQQQRRLLEVKQFLKTDFKRHLNNGSTFAGHCLQYALSDPNDHLFRATEEHQHSARCSQCEEMKLAVAEITDAIRKTSWSDEEQNEVFWLLNEAVNGIDELINHQVRTF